MMDPRTRRTRRFGFVTFETLSETKKALEDRPHKIDGVEVDTKEATPRDEELERERERVSINLINFSKRWWFFKYRVNTFVSSFLRIVYT